MSQGDAQGLLSEEEIKEYLQKSLDLDLDRDALIKPTSSVVFAIYSKFLDEIYCFQWRNSKTISDDNQESYIKPLLAIILDFTINRYDVAATFQMKDLLRPTRKRTSYFLNVLIFVRAQFEELDSQWQAQLAEYSENKEDDDKASAQLRSLRILRDELAVRKSSSKSIYDLNKIRGQERAAFDDRQNTAAKFHEEAKVLKGQSKILVEKKAIGDKIDVVFQQLEKDIDSLKNNRTTRKNLSDLKNTLQTLASRKLEIERDCSKSQKKIETSQRLMNSRQLDIHEHAKKDEFTNRSIARAKQGKQVIATIYEKAIADQAANSSENASLQYKYTQTTRQKENTKVQYNTKIERFRKDLNIVEDDLREFPQPFSKATGYGNEKEAVKEGRAALVKRLELMKEEYQAQADLVSKQLDTISKRYEEWRKKGDLELKKLEEYNSRLEIILGKPKEVELPANRTYIKESGSL